MRRFPTILSCLAIGLVSTLSATAQSTSSDAPTFGEIIDVRVINLEVVVTEGKNRVSGLGSEDFSLLVDGREVPIEYFTEVQGGTAVSAATVAEGAIPALAPGEAVGTRFLVFIDEAFAMRHHRNRVLRSLRDQLPHLGPDDHMAVVAFDGREIDLLTSWTRSLPELERVFEQAQQRKAYGLHRRVQTQAFYRPARVGFSTFGDRYYRDPFFNDYSLPRFAYATRGSLAYSDTDRVLDAATSVLRGFAKPPGRKVMLLLSGGWPIGGTGGFTPAVGYRAGGSDRALLRPLTDTANRLGYTLYPVDVKGLETYSGGSAEFGTLGGAAFARNFGRQQEWLEESALVYLAEETGGRALIDGASLSALQRTVEDTRSYYWLGFTPSWQEDDRRHRVKVEVRRKGLKVRSRNSFSDLSRQTEVSMLLESAQLFALPMPGEDLELGVSFGEPQPGGFRKVIVPLKLEIPLDQVTLLPYAGGRIAHLELRVAATDDRGRDANIPVIPVELRGESAGTAVTGALELSLKLRRRPHRLLISVHDPASGNLISKRVDLTL